MKSILFLNFLFSPFPNNYVKSRSFWLTRVGENNPGAIGYNTKPEVGSSIVFLAFPVVGECPSCGQDPTHHPTKTRRQQHLHRYNTDILFYKCKHKKAVCPLYGHNA